MPPIHEKGNCILCLRNTAQFDCFPCTRARIHAHRRVLAANHRVTNINMVAVQVVRDITLLTRPGPERLKLELGLAHVRVEVVEVAEGLGLCAGVRVSRVEALVVLDEDEDVVPARGFQERNVFGEGLDGGLGDQDVDPALDGVQGDGEVSWVWGEDGDCGAFAEGVDGGFVGVRVGGVVGGEGGEGGVEVVVDLGDVFVKVFALYR